MIGRQRLLVLAASVAAAAAVAPVASPALVAPAAPDRTAATVYTWPGAVIVQVATASNAETGAGSNFGYVRSTPYLIDCPAACIRPVAPNQVLTLTAVPNPGHTFVGWVQALHGQDPVPGAETCPGVATCDFTFAQDTDVVAIFR